MIKYHKNHLIRHYEFMIVNPFKLYKRIYIRIKLLNNISPYNTRCHYSFIFTCFLTFGVLGHTCLEIILRRTSMIHQGIISTFFFLGKFFFIPLITVFLGNFP